MTLHANVVQWVVRICTVAALLLAMDALRLFGGVPLFDAVVRLETHYFYGLIALLLPLCFLTYASRSRLIDAALALGGTACAVYFFVNAEAIVDEGWEFEAPATAVWVSYTLWLIALEAVRRAAGLALLFIVAAFSIYPVFAESMPGPISGLASTWAETAAYHLMSIESVLGVPFRAFANLVIGFLVFGVALQSTGGGRFFIDFAIALLGHVRGGRPRWRSFRSGLMGSMSGSVITNVLTTGAAHHSSDEEKRVSAGICRPASRPAPRPAACCCRRSWAQRRS